MKKLFCSLILLLTFCSTMFANSFYVLKSGSSEVKYKYFYSATVINKSGWSIKVNGTTIFNNSEWNFYDDYVIIESDSYKRLQAFYEFEGSKIIIYIID